MPNHPELKRDHLGNPPEVESVPESEAAPPGPRVKAHKQRKCEEFEKWCERHGIDYIFNPDCCHFVLKFLDCTVDVWPTNSRFKVRGAPGHSQVGGTALIETLKKIQFNMKRLKK